MSEKNIVICDSEFRYANNLMENIVERKELAVRVYVCTTWENVKELSSSKTIHILIVDEQYPQKERSKVNAQQIFVLTTGVCNDLQPGEKSVYKYQCVDQILAEIFEVYFEKTKESMMKSLKKGHVKLLAVYSPIHRAGKTTFAVAFGRELAKYKKVLYLNMEEYAGFGSMFESVESGNLGDALYYTKQENGNLAIRLSMLVKTIDDLDYISPMSVSLDLKEVLWEEWENLLIRIVENSVYEMVILDIGESVQGLFQMLHRCDKIYMPILEDHISQEKIEQYHKNLEKLEMEELREKTCQFVVPKNVDDYVRQLVKEEK